MSEPREKPMLFSSEMINAILDGRKTMTRRILKKQPPFLGANIDDRINGYNSTEEDAEPIYSIKVPYKIGDRIWVRETYSITEDINGSPCVFYKADKYNILIGTLNGKDELLTGIGNSECSEPEIYKPSIFMPRWASRITLEVTDIKVDRLHNVSEEDARKEGYTYASLHAMHEEAARMGLMKMPDDPLLWFRELWNKINGERIPWNQNPWVWVVKFKLISVLKA